LQVLDAAHRKAVGAVIRVRRVHAPGIEVQIVGIGTGGRRRPVVAVAAPIVERPIGAIAVAG